LIDTGPIGFDPAVRGHVLSGSYYSTDGGETWASQRRTPNQEGPYAFDPRGNGTVLQSGFGAYAVSRDGGRTWDARQPPKDAYRLEAFLFDLLRPNVVYTWSGGKFYRSIDNAESFVEWRLPFEAGSLSSDPRVPGRLFATPGWGPGLWRSDDSGTTWLKIVADEYFSRGIVRNCGMLFSAVSNALTRSTDDGRTWRSTPSPESVTFGPDCVLYGAVRATSVYLFKYSAGGERRLWGLYLDGSNPVTVVNTIVPDGAGGVLVAGTTSLEASWSTPWTADVWVARVDGHGKLLYSTSFGGTQRERVMAVAVSPAGEAHVVGSTASTDFPVTLSAQQTTAGGSNDGFLAVIDRLGMVSYASYVGAESDDTATSVAIDSEGRIAIGGYSERGAQRSAGFLILSDRPGSGLRRIEQAALADSVDAIAIGPDRSIYATGIVDPGPLPVNFPVTRGPFTTLFNGAPHTSASCATGDRFLMRLRADTLDPIYSARFGTNCASRLTASLLIRENGTAVLLSYANDTFPHRSAGRIGGGLFWTELSGDGSDLLYSSAVRESSSGAFATLVPEPKLWAISGENLVASPVPGVTRMSVDHMANAFSGVGNAVAPGGLYSLTGVGLGPSTPVWLGLEAADPPTELGGVRVFFDTVQARILYASRNRILCIAPESRFSKVEVRYRRRKSNSVAVAAAIDPGLLGGVLLPEGGMQPSIENADGSRNGPANAARRGSQVVLYANGLTEPISVLMQGKPVGSTMTVDPRFAAKVYRVRITIPPDSSVGAIPTTLARRSSQCMFGICSYTNTGNAVRVYVQ